MLLSSASSGTGKLAGQGVQQPGKMRMKEKHVVLCLQE
jgi:hypothetical protein